MTDAEKAFEYDRAMEFFARVHIGGGLVLAITRLHRLHRLAEAEDKCVEAAARERLAQAIQEGQQPEGTAWNGHYLTAAAAILAAAGAPSEHIGL